METNIPIAVDGDAYRVKFTGSPHAMLGVYLKDKNSDSTIEAQTNWILYDGDYIEIVCYGRVQLFVNGKAYSKSGTNAPHEVTITDENVDIYTLDYADAPQTEAAVVHVHFKQSSPYGASKIKLGGTSINKLYLGGTQLRAAYLGGNRIFGLQDKVSFGADLSHCSIVDSNGNPSTVPTEIVAQAGQASILVKPENGYNKGLLVSVSPENAVETLAEYSAGSAIPTIGSYEVAFRKPRQGFVLQLNAQPNTYSLTYNITGGKVTDEVSIAWNDIQKSVRDGTISTKLAVKDQLQVMRDTNRLDFDILDFDKHTPKNSKLTHSLPLGLHNVFTYGTMPFSASQLMYYTENGLPAGKYKFTLDHAVFGGGTQYDGTYMFTLTQAIPADGGFRHTNPIGGWKNSYAQSDVLGNYITTYGARPKRTEVEKNVTVSVWDGTTACTDLGTFTARSLSYHTEEDSTNGGKRNFTERQAYGSNRWRDSVYRQWLNSDAEAVGSSDNTTVSNWWKPATVFDIVPKGAKWAGFLNGLDPEFVAVLGEVEVKTALCGCDRVNGATYDITYDKVWLQSQTEIFGSNDYGIAEGSQLAYWVGATDADRIKYENTTARHWWLRSPYSSYAVNVRLVNPSGDLYGVDASIAYGVVPACCII